MKNFAKMQQASHNQNMLGTMNEKPLLNSNCNRPYKMYFINLKCKQKSTIKSEIQWNCSQTKPPKKTRESERKREEK